MKQTIGLVTLLTLAACNSSESSKSKSCTLNGRALDCSYFESAKKDGGTDQSDGEEITTEEYFRLNNENKEAYGKVEPGMTSEYSSNFFLGETDASMEECQTHEKNVVISTDIPKRYLVYKKTTLLNDCGSDTRGSVTEKLYWEQYFNASQNETPNDIAITYKSLIKNGNIINIVGTYKFDGEMPTEFMTSYDLTQSQFYAIIEDKVDNLKSKLLSRGYTDPASINIDNLEIYE